MFYEYLDLLCAERGLTVTELMKKLNLNPSSASRWKSKGYLPSRAAAKQIADFFGITVSELLSGGETETKKPTTSEDDELNRYLDELRNRSEMRMLFSISEGCTKEEVEQAVRIIEALRKKEN